MRKLYKFLLVSAVALGFAACSNIEEDLFDESSANRVDASIEETAEILMAATNGWRMTYFLNEYLAYGGYNTLLKFNTDGSVEAACELFDSSEVGTSLYSVSQNGGVTVSFDTYNDVFSALADPGDPFGAGGTGEGMGGENDFLVISASADEVIFKGKKSGNYAVLTPLETSDWTTYLDELAAAESAMYSLGFEFVQGTETTVDEETGEETTTDVMVSMSTSYHTITFFYYDEEGNLLSTTGAYIVNPDYTMSFYEPVEFLDYTISGMVYDAETDSFTTYEGDTDITITKVIPPLSTQLVTGTWYFGGVSECGSYTQTYFNYGYNNGVVANGWDIDYMYMSPYSGYWSFYFVVSGTEGRLDYTYTVNSDTQVKLVFALQGSSTGVTFYSSYGFSYFASAYGIGSSSGATFNLTTDDEENPTWIKLQNASYSTRSFVLYKAKVEYPMSK